MAETPANIYSQIQKNSRSTWFFLILFILLFLFIGMGCDYFRGGGVYMPFYTGIAAIFGIGSSVGAYFKGDQLVLSSTHARPLNPDDVLEKQWQNVVQEMSIAGGIPAPKIYVIDDQDPNAFATGRDPQHSSIAVTSGLLQTLNREEQQAVAAHEMSHIRNFDIRLMLVIAVLVGSLALLADMTRRSMLRQRQGERNGKSGGAMAIIQIVWVVAIILAPLFSRLIAMCVSRRREFLADASGAELTRNPEALASALQKIAACSAPTASIHQGTTHLCIADPNGGAEDIQDEGLLTELFSTHPSTKRRIQALRQMAYQLSRASGSKAGD